MTNPPADAPRFRIVQPVSGHLTYVALDAFFRARYALPPMRETMHLPKTAFYLQDNAHSPPRTIAEAFPDDTEAHDENRAS